MKVDFEKFPTIKNLADDVREKALEYAASLGARGPRPTTVLGTAVTLAKEWKSGRLAARPVAAPFLVQPRQGRWVIKRSNEADPSHTFQKKDDAVRRAQELAKAAGAACFVFGPGGTLIERYEAKALAKLELAPAPVAEVVVPEVVVEMTALPEVVVEIVAEPVAEVVPEVVVEIVALPEVVVEMVAEPVAEVVPEVVVEMTALPEVVVEIVAEPVAEVVPEVVVEMVALPEVVVEMVALPEVVVEMVAEPVAEVVPEVVAELDDDDALPTANPSGEDPIRVKKLSATKWALIVGDGRTETHASQKKAVARAKAIAKKSGRAVVIG